MFSQLIIDNWTRCQQLIIYFDQRVPNNNILSIIAMKNGHRRTQSDDYYSRLSFQKPEFKFKLRSKQKRSQISTLLQTNNRNHKIKTTFIQQLEKVESDQKSHHGLMFQFGRKSNLNSTRTTGTNTNRQKSQNTLVAIPQKKPISQLSVRKSNNKQIRKNCNKSQPQTNFQKPSKMVVHEQKKKIKKESPYLLLKGEKRQKAEITKKQSYFDLKLRQGLTETRLKIKDKSNKSKIKPKGTKK